MKRNPPRKGAKERKPTSQSQIEKPSNLQELLQNELFRFTMNVLAHEVDALVKNAPTEKQDSTSKIDKTKSQPDKKNE